MSGSVARGWKAAEAAAVVGIGAAFVAAVWLARFVGPALFVDRESSWAVPRLALALALALASAGAGAAAGGLFLAWGRTSSASSDLEALPLKGSTLAAILLACIVLGACVRFAGLDELPFPTWHDDLLLAPRALALEGTPRDFRDAIRPVTDGRGQATGTVGVLYLEAYRMALLAFGTNVFGVRLLSALGGLLSIVTAAALARALLPRGGATLAALVLAGLRWHLILSRWSWVMIVVAPILDAAALCAIAARRRGSLAAAAAAGVLAGVGAHVYLSAWIGLCALLLLVAWPNARGASPTSRASRTALACAMLAGFLLASAPLFLLHEGRQTPYFVRSSRHNVIVEMRRSGSATPLLNAAADALMAPWFLPDPEPRHDITGRKRLPVIVGIALAAALARALLRPGGDLSAYLLANAAAALAASAVWGEEFAPNGARFAYLTSALAVGAAAGLLWLVSLLHPSRRRAATWIAVGLVAIAGVVGARDLALWADLRPTFDGFIGQETMVGRAAMRWDRLGQVRIEFAGLYSPLVVDTIRHLRVAPRSEAAASLPAEGRTRRAFRFLAPGSGARDGERVVERVRDAWGREWAIVVGSRP